MPVPTLSGNMFKILMCFCVIWFHNSLNVVPLMLLLILTLTVDKHIFQ